MIRKRDREVSLTRFLFDPLGTNAMIHQLQVIFKFCINHNTNLFSENDFVLLQIPMYIGYNIVND